MKSTCDAVAERIALDEPLAELDAHVATCERCQRMVAMPGVLGATRHAVDPGLGFSARMTVGAQHRIVARRRHRLAAGLAATVAAGMFGVFVLTREPAREQVPQQPAAALEEPTREETVTLDDDEARALVEMADTPRAR
ncbi:MAG TPA: hypothetical protein VK427_16015, partial [Kofleriaceae bacterium]|nr:hypothetical protein [Kofleriaceae bacterium]